MQRLFVGGSNYGNVYAAILLGFWGTRLWKSYRILAMTFVIWGPGSVHKCLCPSILRRGSGFFILVPHQTIQSRHLLSPHHSKNSIQSMSPQNYYHDSKLSNTIDLPEEQSSKNTIPSSPPITTDPAKNMEMGDLHMDTEYSCFNFYDFTPYQFQGTGKVKMESQI